jgi:aspartate racemase
MVEEHLENLRSVRQLLAGGDVLSVPHVQQVVGALPGCQLINGYGPTENTTFTCCFPVTAVEHLGSSVPIGRPIANTQVYVLDRHLQPVPVGVVGELYTGGAGLARDYWHRPELTAERFLPHPFSQEPGARLYKTGDLVRYRPDGNLEFVGRIDQQVKIRGFRVELGELETILALHPAVRETVVLARENGAGDKHLVAYLVPHPGLAPAAAELRSFVRDKVPEYMMPSAFVLLEAMPLTPNGKVDRQVLLRLEGRPLESTAPYVKPQSQVERTIAALWQDLLHVDKVGLSDNFFDLGGHSLLGTQLVAQLRNTFHVEFPLHSLFAEPTVAGIANIIATAQETQGTVDKIAEALKKLKGLSEEEAKILLTEKSAGN